MIRYWTKRFSNSILTENVELEDELKQIKKEIKSHINKKFAGSLAIRMVDSGSCNA